MGFVRLYNPDTDSYWDAPEESVTHWSSLGWQVADDSREPAPAKSATKDEWAAHAEALGIDTTDMSKAEIQAAVEDATPPASEGGGPLGGDA